MKGMISFMRTLAIIGASGHGKVIADIAAKNGYKKIVFLDDDESIRECGGYPVVGRSADIRNINANVIVGIGNSHTRKRIQESLNDEDLVTLIHPDAVIADSASIGVGSVIMAGVVVNPDVLIGRGCIINTCASLDHDCRIGDFVHVAVGSHLCGSVTVGEGTWIGAGVTVSNNINICQDVMLGAGGVVVKNILEPGTYVGVPARAVKPRQIDTL